MKMVRSIELMLEVTVWFVPTAGYARLFQDAGGWGSETQRKPESTCLRHTNCSRPVRTVTISCHFVTPILDCPDAV